MDCVPLSALPFARTTEGRTFETMTTRRILSDRELKELRRCEYFGLYWEDGQWTVYWTDGDYQTLYRTHKSNRKEAEHILKCLLSNYWDEREDRMMFKVAVKLIRSLSKIELAEIAYHVKDEMQIRGMSGWPLGGNKIHKGVCRAKDLVEKYYDRLDIGEKP